MMGVFESLLNNTFTISRRTRTADGQGGWSIEYTAVDEASGRIRPATGTEREVAAAEEQQISHVLYLAADTDIERGDRVACGTGSGDPAARELVVDVQGIREPSLAGHHLEVDCLERQKEETV
jgi:head-tail adaptor